LQDVNQLKKYYFSRLVKKTFLNLFPLEILFTIPYYKTIFHKVKLFSKKYKISFLSKNYIS